jgi:hypothetical protein
MTEQKTGEDGLRIVRLTAANVKRLKAVDITPDGDVVRITGKNGAGKSSVLDSIAYALGGKALIPAEPIRKGEDSAQVEVDLGSIIVCRRWTRSNTYLEVTSPNGAVFKSPQKLLDELAGRLTFDPLEFTRLDAKAQRAALLGLLGIEAEIVRLDSDRKLYYDVRTKENRKLADAKGALASIPKPPADTPDSPVDVAALAKEYEAAERAIESINDLRTNAKRAADRVAAMESVGDRLRDEAKRIAEQIKANDDELVGARKNADEASEKVSSREVPDTKAIRDRLTAAESINANVMVRHRLHELGVLVAAHAAESEKLTECIKNIDDQKSAILCNAQWPVDGLGFDDDDDEHYSGITLNGVPFEQASSAEQLRTSLAIGMAMNPKLRVLLIRDGSLLDSDSFELIRKAAGDRGYQVWVETVNDGEPVGILIEDGQVAKAAGME